MIVTLATFAAFLAVICFSSVANAQCSGGTPNFVNFTIKFDYAAYRLNWTLTDNDGNVEMVGSGDYDDNYDVVSQKSCVSDGCYNLLIMDSYGYGLYGGWYAVSLNGIDITFGQQDMDGDYASLSFCTDTFISDSSDMDDSIAITFNGYDYSGEIYVYSADTSNYTTLYYNLYDFPTHYGWNESVSNTIYLSSDFDGCIAIELINGYAQWSSARLTFSYSLDGGSSTEMSYQRDWTDESDIRFSVCNDNSTMAPTPAPTFGASDAVFNVAEDGRFKFNRYVGCEEDYYYSNCEASQVIEVNGLCENPRLTMRVLESDYDSDYAQALIYLNSEYIGTCNSLDDACSDRFRKCNRTDELALDLKGYFNVSNEINKIEVGLGCENVYYCGLYFYNDTGIEDYPGLEFSDNNYYYWWGHEFNCVGEIEITCDVWDNYTTSMPTSAPTPSREIDTKYNLTLTIQLGSDEETMVWWLYDELLESKIYQDVGRNYKDDDKVEETFEIEHGCYQLLFNQTDTNIATEDSFSWYRVELNGQTITHGKHGLDLNGSYYWYEGYTGLFWFCTDVWDSSDDEDVEYTLTMNTYLFDGLIYLYDYVDDYDYAWYSYVSNTEADNMDEVVSTTWNLKYGCYLAVFLYDYGWWWYYEWDDDSDFWYELIANGNVTVISSYESQYDDYSWAYFCTNISNSDDDSYSNVDCSDNDDGDIGFGFSIKFDSWPDEVDWKLKLNDDEDGTSVTVFSGSGDYYDDYEEEYHTTCLEPGCYDFEITDSYGDGMYHNYGDYGWFRVYLNNSEITFGKQGVTKSSQEMYFCTRLFVSDNNDPMHSLVIRSIANDTKYKIFDCSETMVYRNEMFTPGFLYYYDDEFDGSVAELNVVEGCYYIQAKDNFTILANGDGLDVEIYEVDDDGDAKSYQAFVCLGDATLSSCDNGSSSNDESSGAVIAVVVIVIILVIVGVIVIVQMRNKKQSEEVKSSGNVDMLPDSGATKGTATNNGQTAGGWDMGRIDDDGNLPSTDGDTAGTR